MWYHLERESPLLAKDVLKLLHVTPKYCLYRRLSRMKGIEYVPIDLQPAPLAGQTAALARLPFPSDRVGGICVHVLEHAASDLEAMKEPGGVTVVNVPTRLSHPTFEEPTITAPEARRAAIDEIHAELTGQIMDYLTSRGRIPGMHDRPGGFG